MPFICLEQIELDQNCGSSKNNSLSHLKQNGSLKTIGALDIMNENIFRGSQNRITLYEQRQSMQIQN